MIPCDRTAPDSRPSGQCLIMTPGYTHVTLLHRPRRPAQPHRPCRRRLSAWHAYSRFHPTGLDDPLLKQELQCMPPR